MNVEGSLTGKSIITYKPKGNKKYTYNDISQHLKKFQLYKALRLIGEISFQNLFNSEAVPAIKGVPIHDGILAYLSMQLIANSNDYRSQEMQIDDLLKVIDMYFGLTDPILENDKENINGFLIRLGSSQFDYDQTIRTNLISRTIIIYRDLWSKVEEAKHLVVNEALEKMVGLDIEEILALSQVFCATSKQGFFCLLEQKSSFPDWLKNITDKDKQAKFVAWVTWGYKDFREAYRSNTPIKPEYEKSRFNPLVRRPVLIPDRNLTQGSHDVFLTPVPRLLYLKPIYGLYFDLADFFKAQGGANPFRSAFGSVFQEYIGLLLRKSFQGKNIKSECKYPSKKGMKDTPDWFILDDKRAILIEVKQSCLYLEAKSWGDLDTIRQNLKNTIGSGIKQIWKFENDVKSTQCKELDFLAEIDTFEHLVVTYDRSYFLNSSLRQQIKEIYPEIPENYHWHTISIDELEYFLPLASSNIFEILERKRLSSDTYTMDFKEYCIQEFPNSNWSNPYLNEVYDNFFSGLDNSLPTLNTSN